MAPPHGDLEIVIKVKDNGDFTMESNSRENFRVLNALAKICRSLAMSINAKNGRLILPQNHKDQFTLN